MLNNFVSNLMQRVVSSDNAPYMPQRVARQPQPVYLELKLFEENSTSLTTVTEMKPGKRYFLEVWATLQKLEGQIPVVERSQLKLSLRTHQETISINHSECTLECCLNEYQPLHRFSLNIAEECPVTEVELWFFYQNTRLPLKTKLAGNYFPPKPEFLETCGITDTPLEKNTAIVHIQKDKDIGFNKTLQIKGWAYHQHRHLEIKALAYEEVSLGKLIEEIASPEKIRNKIRSFFCKQSNLILWLKHLIECYQNELTLIIVDYTASEQPWEMIELDENCYLGAYANVVRWTRLEDFGEQRQLEITADSLKPGQVLYYFDNKVTQPEEKQLFAKLATIPCQNVDQLKQQLNGRIPKKRVIINFGLCKINLERK